MAIKGSPGRQFGYRTEHTKWWDVQEHARVETEELGNAFPDVSHLTGHEGIWVTHTKKAARRYGPDVREVDLTGAEPIHYDDDGGYFYVREKKK